MIPKIIHYCWLSSDPIPQKLRDCMGSWKKKLPDYEFMLWDLNRFDIHSSMWVNEAYEAKKYAFAADYIRLYAVYNYGGIYMDMDVEVVRSFDELLTSSYILGLETKKGVEAGIFGAEKNNPFIGKCMDYYKIGNFVSENGKFDLRTLPNIMYEILIDNYEIANRTSIKIEEDAHKMQLFSPDYLTAKSCLTGELMITENTYTIHHFAGSWISKSQKMKGKIYRFISSYRLLNYIYQRTYKKLKR